MVVTFLTKSTGVLSPIAYVLGLIMNAIFEFLHLFGIQNIALSIVLFTFIVRTLMLPLTIKQQKFTKLSSKMNPELQKIQAKYKGKKDEVSLKKQQEETQIIYQKYGANPTAGCLPMLITLPIMFALYSVINNIPAYVGQVKDLYDVVATQLMNANAADILSALAQEVNLKVTDFSTTDKIIDVLAKFRSVQWESLATSLPDLKSIITSSFDELKQVNNFFGMNIANVPGWGFPGILIPILAMSLQFIQGKQLEVKNKDTNKENPSANAMKSMNVVMPIMSGIFCVGFPIGVGIYWIATSVYAIVQQLFVNKYMDSIDVDELIAKNVAKASKRKSIMGANGASLQDLAKKQTRSIESVVLDKSKNTDEVEKIEKKDDDKIVENTSESPNPKSISEIANLLKNRNSEKGDK